MKNMKKLTAMLLALMLLLALTACGGKTNGEGGGTTNDNPYNLDYTSEELQTMTDERASKDVLAEAEEYFINGLSTDSANFSKLTYKDVAEHIGVDASEFQHYESYGQDRYTWYVEGNSGPSLLVAFYTNGGLYAVTGSID